MENVKQYVVSRKRKGQETQYLTENKKWDYNRDNAMIFNSYYKADMARIQSFTGCIRELYPVNLIKIERI